MDEKAISSTEASLSLQLEIAELMVQALNLDIPAIEIQPDEPLYGSGLGLDSIDILEIALVVSKRYGLQLRADSEDNHRIFSSLNHLTEYVSKQENALMLDSLRTKILRIARFIGLAALFITYALLVHHVNTSGQVSTLGATLALVPLLLLGVALLVRPASRIYGIVLLAILAALAWSAWPLIKQHTSAVFWLQDISLLLVLFATFGRSLLAGRKPLCVGFAEVIHSGTLPPSHVRYAYWVTVAWVVFFGVMAIISTLLFFLRPLVIWSVFVNFLTLPLVALMFIIEYLIRRSLLPDAPSADIFAAVKAYRNMSLRKH